MHQLLLAVILLLSTSLSLAESATPTTANEKMAACLETSVANADATMTVKELREACKLLLEQTTSAAPTDKDKPNAAASPQPTSSTPADTAQQADSPQAANKVAAQIEESNIPVAKKNPSSKEAPQRRILQDRLTMEALNRSNRFLLTPHKRNFLLPISYSEKPNIEPYEKANSLVNDLNHTETELQLSVKILLRENIFDKNGHLYLGYTDHAFWQVYNRSLSAPFRETDHQPELILSFTNDMKIFGFHNVLNEAIVNHQSNGQTGLLSRSWNRIMLNSVFEKDNLAFVFTPWYRLPEDKQKYEGDPRGDDNPDISDYMGHFELSGSYKYKSDIFNIQIRNNLQSENRGAVELSWTFPVSKTMRGYLNYFDGYGHSLIDYNQDKQVIGLGIIFTDLF